MDVSVAIIQLRQSALSDRTTLNAADYDVLLVGAALQPSTSTHRHIIVGDDKVTVPQPLRQLPRCHVPADCDPSEMVLRLIRRLTTNRHHHQMVLRRAIRVGLWNGGRGDDGERYSHTSQVFFGQKYHGGTLYCVPMLEIDKSNTSISQRKGRFENLSKLLNLCINSSDLIDIESRHLILRLDEWLRERQQTNARFIANLFLRSPAGGRIRICTHNPAHDPDESRLCHIIIGGTARHDAENNRKSCELADEVRRGNDARAKMIFLEKYDVFIMNPLYGAGLDYRSKDQTPEYFAKGRPRTTQKRRASMFVSLTSDTGADDCIENDHGAGVVVGTNWEADYPLHYYAYLGQADAVRRLLANGAYDANRPDADSWTPLHYAAWYGRLEVMQMLLNYGRCDVNIRNKSGSTALHFAALYGHAYMVELLLSHPGIALDAKDKDGKRALDLCKCVPKPEWQAVAHLIESASDRVAAKIQVDMMDGSNAMLSLVAGNDTTAAQLHREMCTELRLGEAAGRLFAIWICSDRLTLQLKADHKVMAHMQKWKTKILPRWTANDGPDSIGVQTTTGDDEARLMFRRDARATLNDERNVRLNGDGTDNNDMALTLLCAEAQQHYMNGLYPCSDADTLALAALKLQLLYGQYDSTRKTQQHITDEKMLRMLVPQHKQPNNAKAATLLLHKITNEYRSISSRFANISRVQAQFLSICWNLCVYGSTFFSAIVFMNKPTKGTLEVHVGVNDYGLHLINRESKTLFQTYPLKGLDWTHKVDKPYLDIRAKQLGHSFVLQTPQANHINMLLSKLLANLNTRSSIAISSSIRSQPRNR